MCVCAKEIDVQSKRSKRKYEKLRIYRPIVDSSNSVIDFAIGFSRVQNSIYKFGFLITERNNIMYRCNFGARC